MATKRICQPHLHTISQSFRACTTLGRSQPEAHRAGRAVSSSPSIHCCFELFLSERSRHQGKYGALATVIDTSNRHSNDRDFGNKSNHSIARMPMSEYALHGSGVGLHAKTFPLPSPISLHTNSGREDEVLCRVPPRIRDLVHVD